MNQNMCEKFFQVIKSSSLTTCGQQHIIKSSSFFKTYQQVIKSDDVWTKVEFLKRKTKN